MDRNIANWEQIAASEYGDALRDPMKVAEVAEKLGLTSGLAVNNRLTF
jgi:hypothetical protein